MMKIQDNFLPKEKFKSLQDWILGNNFPWHYQNTVSNFDDKSDFFFVHNFLFDGRMSYLYTKIQDDLFNHINFKKCFRLKANCYTKKPKHCEHGWHTDLQDHHLVGLLTLNDNNGYTEFEDGKKIESVSNRFIFFDGKLKHRSVTQTDTNIRVNLNFNFLKENNI